MKRQPRRQGFSLKKNGWGGKRPWHRLVRRPLVHPKILGVIKKRYVKSRLRVVPHFPSGIVERAKRERV